MTGGRQVATGGGKDSARLRRQRPRHVAARRVRQMPRTDGTTLLDIRAGEGLAEWSAPYPEGGGSQQREGTCSRSFPEADTGQTPGVSAAAPPRPGGAGTGSQLPPLPPQSPPGLVGTAQPPRTGLLQAGVAPTGLAAPPTFATWYLTPGALPARGSRAPRLRTVQIEQRWLMGCGPARGH